MRFDQATDKVSEWSDPAALGSGTNSGREAALPTSRKVF
jgi:hypothetical protein